MAFPNKAEAFPNLAAAVTLPARRDAAGRGRRGRRRRGRAARGATARGSVRAERLTRGSLPFGGNRLLVLSGVTSEPLMSEAAVAGLPRRVPATRARRTRTAALACQAEVIEGDGAYEALSRRLAAPGRAQRGAVLLPDARVPRRLGAALRRPDGRLVDDRRPRRRRAGADLAARRRAARPLPRRARRRRADRPIRRHPVDPDADARGGSAAALDALRASRAARPGAA